MEPLSIDESMRPTVSLGGLLTEVGSTVLDVAYGRVDPDAAVSAVVLLDPFDPPTSLEGAIVLGAGISGPAAIIDLLEVLSEGSAVALVLREPVGFDADVADAVAETGIAVFGLSRGVGWVQVATAFANILAVHAPAGADEAGASGRIDTEYLFEIANAVSQLLDAPITIEDLNSHIVAYSDDQGRADDARKRSVLAKQVPENYVESFRSNGLFKSVYAADEVVHLDSIGDGVHPRAIVRVAAGNEVLGSLWAVVDEPLTGAQERSFVEAARLVALQLMHGRAEFDAERRARRAVLTGLLAGGASARSVARQHQLDSGSFCVLAVELVPGESDDRDHQAESVARQSRIAHALALHLSAVHPGSVAGTVGGTVYGVLHLRAEPESRSAYTQQVAQRFVDRMAKDAVVVTLGSVVRDVADIETSRREADRTMQLVRSSARWAGPRAVRSEDVQMDVLLLEVHERISARKDQLVGPVPELIAFDDENDTDFAKTLDAFLSAFGDIAKTAAVLHLHPNTCRYRLRRIAEMTGLDVNDPDARFNAMLQLRLLAM
ncbi:PucR family transcriptional regulator [Herbiconiux daphne]|uniref:Helix-turn-helix domain-containing protein n=1 Tax=Herbiconiux daphne TaxID=2970914 RepID=A0ABT2H3I8_9MICO|nr:helix-turn-helix domain-containing protein [Herbiconiux daphne]MCS5734498.1 helix-turn-helix domain-containing protein [Herbiconiux daphne]